MRTATLAAAATTAAAFCSVAAGSVYSPGFVWDRSTDWKPGQKQGLGYTYGKPAIDTAGALVWEYQHVFPAGDLGDAHPWFENFPQYLNWDASWWNSGVEVWSKSNDVSPVVSIARIQHVVETKDEFDRVPMVRWMNPTGGDCKLDITGDLTLRWSGNNNLGTNVEISAVIAMVMPDRSFTRLYAEVHADPSPGDQNIGVKKVPINLKGVEVPIGASLLFSVRGSTNVAGRWCDMDDNLTITLKSVEGGCEPDINADGVLDLFDFLASVNLSNAGC